MFGLFLLVGGLGVFICLLDWFEGWLMARGNQAARRRRAVIERERLEAEMAELWPARLQRSIYNQEEDAA